jgi:hypothetical protein
MFAVRPFETKTISWWYSQRNNIDLNPPYQRRSGLWKDKEKSYLIDSMINGYDLPKFYIADFSYINTDLNVNNKQYAVIDGKQRFTTIFSFFNNEFTLSDDIIYEKDQKRKIAGLKYSDIKAKYPEICSELDNFNINVMSVITDDKSKIDDLFVRLNRGKALTGAEIRSAMRGQIPREIARISKHKFFSDVAKITNNRKQDENVVAKLLLLETKEGFVDTKKVDLDKLVEEYSLAETSEIQVYSDKVTRVLGIMHQKFTKDSINIKASGRIPIYYWLFRNNKNLNAKYIDWFDSQRLKSNKDADFVEYNKISRSINDKETLSRCYDIMLKHYDDFISEINGKCS